jgi:hypothetical protein
MDWQEVGLKLEKEWRERKERFVSEREPGGELHRMLNRPDQLFLFLCVDYAEGDRAGLIDYLKSYDPDRPPFDPGTMCGMLAVMLEGKLDPPKSAGRPRNKRVHDAAEVADVFYRAWRRMCVKFRVDHYGKANAMKTQSIRFGVEYWELKLTDDEMEKARELMDAPKSRRMEPWERDQPIMEAPCLDP